MAKEIITSYEALAIAMVMWDSGPDAATKWNHIGSDCQKELIQMAEAAITEYQKINISLYGDLNIGKCCYGKYKTKSECKSCPKWEPLSGVHAFTKENTKKGD